MIPHRNNFIGPLGSLEIGQHHIKGTTYTKLLAASIDNKLTWSRLISELNRGFVNILNLIKRSRFPPIKTLLDLYFSGALARSEAPWVRKFGKLSNLENLVMT